MKHQKIFIVIVIALIGGVSLMFAINRQYYGWQVYEDTEYGYTLRYPMGWEVVTDNPGVDLLMGFAIIPSDLDGFPECRRSGIKLEENIRKYNKSEMDKEHVASIHEYDKIVSCSISVFAEENPNRLSIKKFLEKKFLEADSYDPQMLGYVEKLPIKKSWKTETVLSETFFHYVRGFGTLDGEEEEAFPYFFSGKQQFIAAYDDIVVFVNNNIHEKDLSLPGNMDIFKNVIESFDFIEN